MNNNLLIILAAVAVIGLGVLVFFMTSSSGSNDQDAARVAGENYGISGSMADDNDKTTSEESIPNTTNSDDVRVAVVETNMGTIKMELYVGLTPITAGNFIKLVEQKFYDGLIFHRVIEGFMIQGGDPFCVSGEGPCGTGGPGWSIDLEIVPELKHDQAGMVAMARSSDPNSAGSQFYITLDATDFLDGGYAVFGKVIEGLDVVMAIGSTPTDDQDRPLEDVVMERVYLEE